MRSSPRSYLGFDVAVMVVGLLLAWVTTAGWIAGGAALGWDALAVPAIIGLALYPLVLSTRVGDVIVGLDFGALVVLALIVPLDHALVVWNVGFVLSQLTGKRPWEHRLFNMALGSVDGWLAVTAMHQVGGIGRTSTGELAAVAVGSVVYFLADFGLTAGSVSLESGTSFGTVLLDNTVLLSVTCFAGTASLGYLTVVVLRAMPLWVSALLVVPVVTILAAARTARRSGEDRARLQGLFGAAQRSSLSTDAESLLHVVEEQARLMLRCPVVHIQDEAPVGNQIGSLVPGDRPRWLVAEKRPGGRFEQPDRQALDALATVAGEGLARLRLTAETLALAASDPLTGLANRSVFRDNVRAALAAPVRTSDVAVMFCDLDGFKAVNDRLGHEVGDAVLSVIAGRLQRGVRLGDLVARLGGDEFGILLRDVAGREQAQEAGERMLTALVEPVRVAEHLLHVGGSIGLAVATSDDDDSSLLGNADLAMYRAKALGKGRVEVFEHSLRSDRLARIELVEQLRTALDEHQLVVHYQPIVALEDGRIDGFEALVRWQHPHRGLLAPDAFISVCEESGLIAQLGAQVLEQAWADGCLLGADAGRMLSMGVNVSAHQLQDDSLLDQLRRLPEGEHVPGIVLEITESALLVDAAGTQARLARLKLAGAQLALDDFGTGYSSVAYLRQFPFDVCKIDRSFVTDLVQDLRASALLTAVLTMCSSLDVVSLAEGVEDLHQAALLRSAGCRLSQGYQFGRPLPIDEARALARAGRVDVGIVPEQPGLDDAEPGLPTPSDARLAGRA